MFETAISIDWGLLARPYGQAERALGRLGHALETTRLHQTWLWREITRVAVAIAQAGGHQATVDQLRRVLIGAPIDPEANSTGLAVAKRIFLTTAPIFRHSDKADSKNQLWPEFWHGDGGETLSPDGGAPSVDSGQVPTDAEAGEGGWPEQADFRKQLLRLVRDLAGFADDGRRPALINLFIDLRKHAAARHLPPSLMRIALSLALNEAGLVPKAAPGLLGGRRLALGFSRASGEEKPLTDWLKAGLDDLAKEAVQSSRRLGDLTAQHRTWHAALAGEGLRRHARAPEALDLLTATPVLSIGLVARHLGCSHVAAGKIMEKLSDLGILIPATSRSRHKIFIAGDLPARDAGEVALDQPLVSSEPAPLVDVDALSSTLDGLFADLERLNERVGGRAKTGRVGDADQEGTQRVLPDRLA